MTDFIISIIVFVCVGIPLLILLIKTFMGKIKISKIELIVSLVIAVVFAAFCIYRLCSGYGIEAISAYDIYFILLAIADTIAYRKHSKK